MTLLAAVAMAAPVQCDPVEAKALLADARISESRAPVSHPDLLPGLALASPRTETGLRNALRELCAGGGSLSLAKSDHWESAGWSAHAFMLTASENRGCTLFKRTIAITVGLEEGTAPRYGLRSRLPVTQTPVGDCPTTAVWRDEKVLGGAGSPVRLVLAVDRSDEAVLHSEVLVRRATPAGWTEQTLVEPAPDRLVTGGDGPDVRLIERDKWVVMYGDRTRTPDQCTPQPGTSVWIEEGGKWVRHDDRDAVTRLARQGHWRFTGADGWLLILAQGDEDDADVVGVRMRRLQARVPEALHLLPSARFPELNPGFVVVAPGPYPTEAAAEAARQAWRGRRRAYVKRAWKASDPCQDPVSQTPRP